MTSLRRSGLTLVELLVVLLILSILTVVAVQATDTLLDQGRFDVTQRTLQSLEEALLGSVNQRQADGTLSLTGFIADLGRPPLAVGSDPLTQLRELWDKPAGVELFGLKPTADPEVFVPCGWRGPYVRLPFGTDELRTGWGTSFVLLRADGGIPAPGQPIDRIRCLGADNTAGGASFALDTELILRNSAALLDRYGANVSGQVVLLDASGNPRAAAPGATISVVLYGPNPLNGQSLAVAASTVTATSVEGVYNFSGLATTMGPRMIRAYEGTGPTQLRSRPVSLMVPSGGTTVVLQIRSS